MFYNGVGLTKVEFSDGLKITICGSDLNSSLALLNKYWSQLHEIEPNLLYINMCYKDAIAIR
jgi:cell division septal protein FtsQ